MPLSLHGSAAVCVAELFAIVLPFGSNYFVSALVLAVNAYKTSGLRPGAVTDRFRTFVSCLHFALRSVALQ